MWTWAKRLWQPQRRNVDTWNIERSLLHWPDGTPWTMRSSFSGVCNLGVSGSGKTSGPMRELNLRMLRAGYGAVYFTVKPSDVETYLQYAREAGRADDVRVFGEGRGLRYNFIEEELNRPGGRGVAENLTGLISAVTSTRSPGAASTRGDGEAFFRDNAIRLARCALDVLVHAGEPVSLQALMRLVNAAPASREELGSSTWQGQSWFYLILTRASRAVKPPGQAEDFEQTLDFFLREWIDMGSRTRGSVQATLMGAIAPLARGLARDLLSGETNIRPQDCYEGRILIVDLPVLVYGEVGRLVQLVLKHCWNLAAGRRTVDERTRPMLMCIDEAHWLMTDHDWIAQTTLRSSRTCVLMATQSVSNLEQAMGQGAEAAVASYLGNLQLQLFCSQTDARTVQYIQQLIGRRRQIMMNGNCGDGQEWLAPLIGSDKPRQTNVGFSETFECDLQMSQISGLASGGPPHWKVEAIVFDGGKRFRNGRNWQLATFGQWRNK